MPNHADIHSQTFAGLFASFRLREGFVMSKKPKKKDKDLGTVTHKIVRERLDEEGNPIEDDDENEEEIQEEDEELSRTEKEDVFVDLAVKIFKTERDSVAKAWKKKYGEDLNIRTIKNPKDLEYVKDLLGEDEDDEGLGWGRGKQRDMSKTGGKIGMPSKQAQIGDLTEQGENASEIVKAIQDEIKTLKEKRMAHTLNPRDVKPLSSAEEKRLRVLQAKENRLWNKVLEGMKERGKLTKSTSFKCPICNTVTTGIRCQNCGYRYGERVTQAKKDEYILKGA